MHPLVGLAHLSMVATSIHKATCMHECACVCVCGCVCLCVCVCACVCVRVCVHLPSVFFSKGASGAFVDFCGQSCIKGVSKFRI